MSSLLEYHLELHQQNIFHHSRHCCQVRSNVKYVIQSKNRLDFKSVGTTQFNLVGCANSTRFLSGRAPWSEAAISKPGKFYGFMLKLLPYQGVKTKPQLLYLFCMQNKIQRNRNALQNSPKEQSKLKPDKLDEPNMDLSWIPGKNLNTHTATHLFKVALLGSFSKICWLSCVSDSVFVGKWSWHFYLWLELHINNYI